MLSVTALKRPRDDVRVSQAVAAEMAERARREIKADYALSVTGIAGPDGGTPDKPVGTVWFSVSHDDGRRLTRHVQLPGGRFDVRDRSTTVAMHLIRRLLLGAGD